MAEVDLRKISLYGQTELFYAKKFYQQSPLAHFLAGISVDLTRAQTFFHSVLLEYKITFDILCFLKSVQLFTVYFINLQPYYLNFRYSVASKNLSS